MAVTVKKENKVPLAQKPKGPSTDLKSRDAGPSREYDASAGASKGGNILSNADWTTPYKAWKKYTVNPAGSAIAAATIAGGGAYLVAPIIARLMGRGAQMVPGMGAQPVTDEEIAKFRRRLALIAALGAGGLSVASNLDTKHPWKSMTSWNYMDRDRQKTAALKPIQKTAMLGGMGNASNQAVMSMDIIPLDHAKEIVANDRFLTSGQKAAIGTIFDNTSSDSRSGNTSMADLTNGAIRAGLGFAGAAVTAYALGNIFALPKDVTRIASVTGGLAGALRTTGLIS